MSVVVVDFSNVSNDILESAICKYRNAVPPEYQYKIQRFLHIKDKIHCLIGYLLIQKYVGGDIERDDNGRPFIRNKCDFNITHDGKIVAIIIDSLNDSDYTDIGAQHVSKVGIDVSEIRPIEYKYFTETFTEKEFEFIYQNNDNFFILWALKESYCKLVGTGIAVNLLEIEFELTFDTESYFNCNGKHVQLKLRGNIMNFRFKVEFINNHVLAMCVADALHGIDYLPFSSLI